MRMPKELKGPKFSFEYNLIDIRELDAERLLDSLWLSDTVIAILAKSSNGRESVRRVLRRISKLSGNQRRDALQQLSILAGLRRLGSDVREEAKQMPILADIMDHDLFGPVLREGLQQGRMEGVRDVVRHQIEKRFGPLPVANETQFMTLAPSELDALA